MPGLADDPEFAAQARDAFLHASACTPRSRCVARILTMMISPLVALSCDDVLNSDLARRLLRVTRWRAARTLAETTREGYPRQHH